MPAPRVSIICPFLDREDFIADAIESVLAQDFADFELLLVDDGSTDSSTAIAREYARRLPRKIRCLEHEGHANRGTSAARNLGFVHARADYIAYIDADDVWRPSKLTEQIDILDAYAEAAMVCGTVNYWRSWGGGTDRLVPSGNVRDGLSPPQRTALDVYPLGSADMPCPSDVMIRREAVVAVGGWEEQFTGFYDDCAFFAKIFATLPVWFSSRTWLDYRLHPGSCSATTTSEDYRANRRRFLDWFGDYIEGHTVEDKPGLRRAIARARWALDRPLARRFLMRLRKLRRRLFR